MKYPKKLLKGDTIGVIAGSSPIEKERETACRKTLESLGYHVKLADNLSVNYGGYMAGDGPTRGASIMAMFVDPEVDAIICARGGHGGSRAMAHIDFDIIKQNPKVFVGYSDVTSLHSAIANKCDFPTFHGPMVSSNMVGDFDKESLESLLTAINADESYEFQNPKGHAIEVLKSGSATGKMVGGNLAVMAASIGTFYEIDTKDKILFIEEVGETMGRIERFVYQLKDSGKFADCKGVVLGQFTDCSNPLMETYTQLELFLDVLEEYSIPVLYNIQSGHDSPNMTVTLGAICTIDTEKRTIKYKKPQR